MMAWVEGIRERRWMRLWELVWKGSGDERWNGCAASLLRAAGGECA